MRPESSGAAPASRPHLRGRGGYWVEAQSLGLVLVRFPEAAGQWYQARIEAKTCPWLVCSKAYPAGCLAGFEGFFVVHWMTVSIVTPLSQHMFRKAVMFGCEGI